MALLRTIALSFLVGSMAWASLDIVPLVHDPCSDTFRSLTTGFETWNAPQLNSKNVPNLRLSYDQTVDLQWRVIGPDYVADKVLSQGDIEASKAKDHKTPPANVGYLMGYSRTPDQIVGEGKPDSWMRVVSNVTDVGAFHSGRVDTPKRGIIPLSRYEGLEDFFEAKGMKVLVEPGRADTPRGLKRNRLTRFKQLLETVIANTPTNHNHGPVFMVAESKTRTLESYQRFGFEVIDPAEIREVSPKFELPEDHHIIFLKLSDVSVERFWSFTDSFLFDREYPNPYHPIALQRAVKNVDAAIEALPEKLRWRESRGLMKKMGFLLQLGRTEEAGQILPRLEETALDAMELADLRFRFEAQKRFDPLRGRGSYQDWKSYLSQHEDEYRRLMEAEQGLKEDELGDGTLVDNHRIWLALEAGDLEAAKAYKAEYYQRLRNRGHDPTEFDQYGQGNARRLYAMYDPENPRTDLELALHTVNGWLQNPTSAVSSHLYEYRAHVLSQMGRLQDAINDKIRAEAMKEQSSPSLIVPSPILQPALTY